MEREGRYFLERGGVCLVCVLDEFGGVGISEFIDLCPDLDTRSCIKRLLFANDLLTRVCNRSNRAVMLCRCHI